MDMRRVILYAALVLVIYALWNNWQADYPPLPASSSTEVINDETTGKDRLLPAIVEESTTISADVQEDDEEETVTNAAKTIQVTTDVLALTIDSQHGDIVKAQLLDYPVSVHKPDIPFTLLQDSNKGRYVANSNIFVVKDRHIDNIEFDFSASSTVYKLEQDKDKLVVTLTGKSKDGLIAEKSFIFKRGQYLIDVQYKLTNIEKTPWKGYMNMQLLRRAPEEDKSSLFHIGSYTGASYSNPGEHRYKKVPFSHMQQSNLDVDVKGGWVAMQQHYFLTAWVPLSDSKHRFYTRELDKNYTIGVVSKPIKLMAGDNTIVKSRLYIGPEKAHVLQQIAPGLDLTIDYGWLWFISSLLFSLMKAIYSIVGNWGWSIVLTTVLIKLAFYRLSATSYRSMANMRKMQPKLQALKERYGDDKAKISQATMELYRQEKVNPLGGCLPIVVQIPVFIALYWVLLESVELRQAPFILWINDLASADPYHVLPIIMGITMLMQQRLNPAPPDPTQAKIMMFLPVMFTALFWSFPAGLVLYWVVNNSLSILQQWYITRKYSDAPASKQVAKTK